MSARRPSTPSRGAGKKPRWSAAQKKSAVRGKPTGQARRFERRDGAAGDERPAYRGNRRPFERDERRGSDRLEGDRSGTGRAERYERAPRPERFERPRRDERRDDRPFGRGHERGDRGYDRGYERGGERADRSSGPGRDDRRPRYERDERGYGAARGRDSWQPRREDRDGRDRPGRAGDDRRDGNRFERRQDTRFDRSERFSRDDRVERRPRFERDDRPRRFERDDRPGRFERDDRSGPFERDDRRGRFERDDRPRRFERDDRPGRFERDDRPRHVTEPVHPRHAREGFPTDEADGRRRPERAHGVRSYSREHRPDPTAQRLRNTDRPVVETVEVSPDNAFAGLGLPDALVRRLARDGITEPFPIQAATIPDALAGRDVLGRGRTGSGKTLAFGLPLLTRLSQGEPAGARRPRALVLVPTRELAMQVSDALQPLVHVMGLRHKLVAGGMPYPPQFEALERGVDVLIATPGRLADLVERGACSLDAVEIVVLDEADHMAEMGFLEDVTAFLDQVPAGGQRLLFSATLDRGIDGLVENYLVDPVTHSTDDAQAAVTTMAHHILLVEPAHKKLITADVANRTGRTVVFVRTKLGADRVALQLREQGVFAAALHGGLNQGARNRVLTAFKSGELPVLVATDVAARGIHVDDVSVVLQVDPPADHKDYLHRAGRTARAGEEGTVVTLALPHQRRLMERMAQQAGLGISPVQVRVGDDTILEATGARRPSGVPIPEDRLRRLLEPPRRGRPGAPKRFGRGGPGRGRPAPRQRG